jgi:hypothetical protein
MLVPFYYNAHILCLKLPIVYLCFELQLKDFNFNFFCIINFNYNINPLIQLLISSIPPAFLFKCIFESMIAENHESHIL